MTQPAEKFLPPEHREFETDTDYIRKNQYDLIEQGVKGLEGIMSVAEQSQHPRAYEVLSTYLRTLSELNKDLLVTAEKRKETAEPEPKKLESSQTVNQMFIGSTKELQEMLKLVKRSPEDGSA